MASKRLSQWLDRLKALQGWLLSGAVLLVLLIWNWQFVLSIGLGLAVLIWVYLAQQGWWQPPQWNWQQNWQRLWNRANRSLTIAAISGGGVAIASYLAIAIWREEHFWLGTAVILEGLLLLVVLGLLWQLGQQIRIAREGNGNSLQKGTERPIDPLLADLFADLSNVDPLKRMIAIRQLTHQFSSSTAIDRPMTAADLTDCFRLMLNRETEPAVCSALLDGLHRLNHLPQQVQLEAAKVTTFPAETIGRVKERKAILE
ncbi:hypothetical protein IFO70_07165 [Phormidium tenue FACHB-886]|nr:hypothetical protein [Phormidium tenue FACHB-886]